MLFHRLPAHRLHHFSDFLQTLSHAEHGISFTLPPPEVRGLTVLHRKDSIWFKLVGNI
ncbi:Uncharacterised protein [Providencia rettgeri]|uniref:Uncharacterized protein n=1 Tax=Providencia rettgeri TaxID=587 RepID=A0A379FTW7_PRORE|nr:Uncharacterised protein [Providencia rettgeri]